MKPISPDLLYPVLNALGGGNDEPMMLAVLLPARDDQGNPITKRWRDMTPAEREEWRRRNRNFLRF